MPSGSVNSRVAFSTFSKFNSGSPIPIITMFSPVLAVSLFSRTIYITWPTISPAVRLRSSPISAVRQNLQSTGQPTWLEMQIVSRAASGIKTASTDRLSWRRRR